MKPRRYYLSRRFVRKHVFHYGFVCTLATTIVVNGGDILRGGTSKATTPSVSTGTTNTPAPIVSSAAGSPTDSLARTAQTIQAVQAMQAAARQAANGGANNLGTNPNKPTQVLPDVPDGLGQGGLQVDPRVGNDSSLWQGANGPTQTTNSGGKIEVTIKQTAQQALLNWETFNVGKNTQLTFDQSAGGSNVGQWIAFNKVNDPLANPTQILGSIKADGQVYILNRNGIIFGGSSQVNTHTLVASALPINEVLMQNGLLNNSDHQFLFDGLSKAGSDAIDPNQKFGDVIVQAGAKLEAPTSAEHVGGRVMLVGPNVINEGTISTPDGQTILAAGLQVGVVAHDTSDPSLRGLDVYIGAVVDPASTLSPYAGTAINRGWIDMPRGSVTIAGKEVKQLGAITSTTSVSLNGRIDLMADYNAIANPAYDPAIPSNGLPFLFRSTGNVEIGEGSVTQILPELTSKDKVVGTKLALNSQINVSGHTVHFGNGAILLAPSADVTINAGIWDYVSGSAPAATFVRSGGQIYLDAGAIIDVSGSKNVESSVASNIVEVQLRGTELADSPLLRDGPLRGQTVYIDIGKTGIYDGKAWVGTPLADVSGYVNLVQRTVGELTTSGGTVNLNAGGSVVIQKGASLDVSGGWVNYAGGMVTTTRLMSNGKIFDIADATPTRVYDGIYGGTSTVTHDRWGVTETFTNPIPVNGSHYEEGYVQGGNGGNLQITAPSMALDGSLKGTTVTGPRQRALLPKASSLSLSFQAQEVIYSSYPDFSPSAPTVIFQSDTRSSTVADFALDSNGNPLDLAADRKEQVLLSPELLASGGFGNLTILNPDGDIIVPENVSLTTSPKGSITFSGANIDIQGSMQAKGGSLNFSVHNISPSVAAALKRASLAVTPDASEGRGLFTLGEHASLSTAGGIVDDRPDAANPLGRPLITTGGTISISGYSAELAAGSVIDVSGGVYVSSAGKPTYGNAGSISIITGQDLNIGSVTGGHLRLGSELRGYSGSKGGSLSIQAPVINVGGVASSDPQVLTLGSEFFNQGGFSTFSIAGLGTKGATAGTYVPGVTIAAGTVITPVVQSWTLHNSLQKGQDVSLVPFTQPDGLRSSASLSFTAKGVIDTFSRELITRGDVVMETGSVIRSGPAGSVSLIGDTVAVDGSIFAPGGSITITGAKSLPSVVQQNGAYVTVDLGANATLSTAGTLVTIPDNYGRKKGYVLGGGKVNVTGNLVAQEGSVIDVSGAAGVLDLAVGETGLTIPVDAGTSSSPGGIASRSTRVESNGGSITLTGGEILFSDATLLGNAGGSTATGGSLTVSSSKYIAPGTYLSPTDVVLEVKQSGSVLPAGFITSAGSTIGREVVSANLAHGYFAADRFMSGGFDSLTLGGAVKFTGPVAIRARGSITAGTTGVVSSDSSVDLSASYVSLGMPFQAPLQPQQEVPVYTANGLPAYVPPTYGDGQLNVSADLIDVGNLSLRGIGKASLTANNGDIRGNGIFDVAGDIVLKAGQIYPPTASTFTIAAYDYTIGSTLHRGSIKVESSGVRGLPLSAGGELNLYASSIVQGGTLRAPFGKIRLGWDGSGTVPVDPVSGLSVPIAKEITLAAGSITSVSAIDPTTGKGITIPYGVSLDGTTWLDPKGIDITNTGGPQKSVTISGQSVTTEDGSSVDIRGGGDLYAYRWVKGEGGSVDLLANTNGFAIVPGYQFNYAPYAPFNPSGGFGSDAGYVNGNLKVGDQIRLNGGGGLPAGVYTLLPARYALLPGAYLVKPQSGTANGAIPQADGTTVVSGFQFNLLNQDRVLPGLASRFEIVSGKIVRKRAEYTDLLANTFFKDSGLRLPADSGQLVLSATQSMAVQGQVAAQAATGARGGLIDISSPVDIVIGSVGTSVESGKLFLDAAQLNDFGAESLLIGGIRDVQADGTHVTVTTGNLTVNNAGEPLIGSELILVAKQNLNLAPGAVLKQQGATNRKADNLIIGNASVAGSGNGALLRLSGDASAGVVRQGISSSNPASFNLGAGVSLSAAALTLDSSHQTHLDPTALLASNALAVQSGRISLALDQAGTLAADPGLVLTGASLASLQQAGSLSLLSYSDIDIYGTGDVGAMNASGQPVVNRLSLQAGAIRGYNQGTGTVTFHAKEITLGNQSNVVASASNATTQGALQFDANTIRLGANKLLVDGYSNLQLRAGNGVNFEGNGALSTAGNIEVIAPIITGNSAVTYAITAAGDLTVNPRTGLIPLASSGLGASLTMTGASVTMNSQISLSSGLIALHATDGDVTVNGSLDVGGISKRFKDVVKYTSGGQIRLTSDSGDVTLSTQGKLNVASQSGGGDGGTLAISAAEGTATLLGTTSGRGGAGGKGGVFSLDTGNLDHLKPLSDVLNAAMFSESRSIRVRTGDVVVDGLTTVKNFNLSADAGSIVVTGTVDASGATGGSISLSAAENVTLESGALLDASATGFDNAGKGGSISLETRGTNNGAIAIRSGSLINLGVDANTSTSASLGKFNGTLHLRAPQNASATDLAISSIDGEIRNASVILVEGFKVYDLTGSGAITTTVQGQVMANGTAFTGNSVAIENRLLANNASLASVLSVRPGAEIINRTGDLVLGSTTAPAATGDWNLATFRFGPDSVPGVLTLRAAGNLVFYNSLSDGFTSSTYTSALMARNELLPSNSQAWSYRLVAGADLTATNYGEVLSPEDLAEGKGSLLLGKNAYNASVSAGSGTTSTALTSTALNSTSSSPGWFQVIRTGSGDIDVVAGKDIRLLNPFASIYTVGTRVTDPTMGGTFDVPVPNLTGSTGTLGAIQQRPGAAVQYTMGGGNVNLSAANDIIHLTLDTLGNLIADSQRQMPNNWLYRRGYVNAAGESVNSHYGENASTTWWVDFTNFFEGIGALGGGNVNLTAGRDVSNVDAVAPTNARMAKGLADASKLVELGGGDVTVRAGRNIDGGVYYVERGKGSLLADGDITTNWTRSPSLTTLKTPNEILDPATWLPTTLFLGKGSFDVAAGGNVLLGPVANTFLLPQGFNNTFWYKTYFSTYAADSAVSVESLGGDVTLRAGVSLAQSNTVSPVIPTLEAWYDNVLRLGARTTPTASTTQPWLLLTETTMTPFSSAFGLMPGTLRSVSFSGDTNVVGNITLSPSAKGTLEVLSAGSINGLQTAGTTSVGGRTVKVWAPGSINLSDADPSAIYGITRPLSYQSVVGDTLTQASRTGTTFLLSFDALFAETGSTNGVLQQKQALHGAGMLHAGDTEPVRLYAGDGDISGLTLFSGKGARILAGQDIRDVSFYLQHVTGIDLSIVAAGRDIIAYDLNTANRIQSVSTGNALTSDLSPAGDIQLAGKGVLEVLAGRNLDLGTGANNADGTGNGITTIGNGRNPGLGFDGASVIAAAGLGESISLESSSADFTAFIDKFVKAGDGTAHLKELGLTPEQFDSLDSEKQRQTALQVFFLVLRDSGRDHNDPKSANYGNYDEGKKAVATLFPGEDWAGEINTRARDIRTRSGGDITLFAPGGSLTLATSVLGNPLAPPGIITEAGGKVNVFTHMNVDLGISRIFTLRGGDEIIWSSKGNIAAGSSSKTVQSAPPTRVIIDPQSADVKTDLAGLATGGGIGVLTTVAGVKPSDVDLIAPEGTIDAGDAGIRVSGNINIAAAVVVNAGNISAGGSSSGVPSASVSAPSLGTVNVAASSTTAVGAAAGESTNKPAEQAPVVEDASSLISVEVIGYGGSDDDAGVATSTSSEEDDEKKKKKSEAEKSE